MFEEITMGRKITARNWKEMEAMDRISTKTMPRCAVRKATGCSPHAFSYASRSAVCAVVYLVNTCPEPSGNLVASKSRVVPKSLSILRLELVAVKLLNIRKALHSYSFNFKSIVCSTAPLYFTG